MVNKCNKTIIFKDIIKMLNGYIKCKINALKIMSGI